MRSKKLFALIFLVSSIDLIAQKQPVLVTDMLKIKTASAISASKDGTKALCTVTTIDPEENNKLDYKYTSQLYLLTATNNYLPVQLTFSKEGASQPVLSDDGKEVAFVRAVDGKPQLFLINLQGGEARQLTKFKYGAANPKWSPDGKNIIFTSAVNLNDLLSDSVLNPGNDIPSWNSEKPGFQKNAHFNKNNAKPNADGNIDEVRAYLQNDEKDKKAIVLNKLNFQNEFSITSDLNFNKLFVLNINSPLDVKQIGQGFYNFNNGTFTPDGEHIIFSGSMDSVAHPDRVLETGIFISDKDGKNIKVLLSEKGKRFSNPSVSHSGRWLAFQSSNTSFISVPELELMPLAGGVRSTIKLDRSKGEVVWSSNDKYLYFAAQSNGGVPLYRYQVATKKLEQLSTVDAGVTSFELLNGKVVYAKTQVNDPSDIFLADEDLQHEKQLSNFNSWVLNKNISAPEKHSFKNEQGMTVEYWTMKPANYIAGNKYPLLLEIHGGPSAMWGPGESSMWHEFQYFCSKGYGIVYSNPRGSGGYGIDYLKANINDWGTGPTSDVLTALDRAVTEGWADTSKLLITGGSYAGYLTAWIIAHDHRFKAACSQRGVYDLATFFGEGNAWRLVPNYFGGYPWEPKVKEILVRESPITYVQNITTPYIIFHGGSDRRTGFVQGEMMYRSLKILNRPVEYVVHPNATHELTRSGDNRQRIDQMLRTYEFFQRWIK